MVRGTIATTAGIEAATETETEIEGTEGVRDLHTIDRRDATTTATHTRPAGTIELGNEKTDMDRDGMSGSGTEENEARDVETMTGRPGETAICSTTEEVGVAAAAVVVGGIETVVVIEADEKTATNSPPKPADAGTVRLPRNANLLPILRTSCPFWSARGD